MKILELHSEIESYLEKHKLAKKFGKQKDFFELNPFHPSLNTELLEPKKLRFMNNPSKTPKFDEALDTILNKLAPHERACKQCAKNLKVYCETCYQN